MGLKAGLDAVNLTFVYILHGSVSVTYCEYRSINISASVHSCLLSWQLTPVPWTRTLFEKPVVTLLLQSQINPDHTLPHCLTLMSSKYALPVVLSEGLPMASIKD
jgi:hypothetical protein